MLALALVSILAGAGQADAEATPVVSVLYFETATKDPELEPMSKGLADLLLTDLVAWNGVRVVERSRLEDVLKELDFQQTKYVDKKSAAKLGQVLGATHLVYGTIVSAGDRLEVTARLVNARDGEVVAAVKEGDEKDKIFDVEQRLAADLMQKIDDGLTANAQARRKARVPDLQTLVAYGKALELADQDKLEEAQVALRAVVSKAPSFLLARERQQQLLKRFQEYQSRKADLITGSVLEVFKRTQHVDADAARFAQLSPEAQAHHLALRWLRGRILARQLKQTLDQKSKGRLLPLEQDEAKTLVAVRAWLANQRAFIAEYQLAAQRSTWLDPKLTPEETALIEDSQLGKPELRDGMAELYRFAFDGSVTQGVLDGHATFDFGPVPVHLDPNLRASMLKDLDGQVRELLAAGDRAREMDVKRLLDVKAGLLLREGDVDGAIATWQKFLDAYPSSSSASWLEKKIAELLEGKGNELRERNFWVEALSTCDDMKFRQAASFVSQREALEGVRAVDHMYAELKKACLPAQRKNRGGIAQFIRELATSSADHEDCARYQTYAKAYFELDGNVSDMVGYAKWYPWCSLGDALTGVNYVRGMWDDSRDLDLPRLPRSILSSDQKVLSLSAGAEPVKDLIARKALDLRLERKTPGDPWVCTSARYEDGDRYEGTCEVKLTTFVPPDGVGHDEGTFTLKLRGPDGRTRTLQRGEFRLNRER